MTPPPANRMTELPQETREFLAQLSKEDIDTFKTGLPIIRMIVSFGKVTKWLAITLLGFLLGVVLLWESVVKIMSWLRPALTPPL